MRHTRIALSRPVTTWMAFAAAAVIGAFSAVLLPLEQFPKVALPFVGISIPFPGSTPQEIEELVTRPVEDALATLPAVRRISSTTRGDEVQLRIELDWGTDVQAAGFEVRSKLDSIRHTLPTAANRILLFNASSADLPVLTVRLSAAQDLSTRYELLESALQRPIERVPGVARVELAGVEPRELRILVDAGRVAAHGVDVRELVTLLERSNFAVSGGSVTSGAQRLLVRPLGELRSIDDVRNLRIAPALRLADLAGIELVNPELTARRNLDGRPAVGLDVFRTSEANVVDVVDRVLAIIDGARALPEMRGITVFVIDDQARSVRRSLADVAEAGLLGAVLATLVLYGFLRHWPTTLAVSLAVPAALLITLGVMYFVGLSLNVMTLMGMMLAIGMLVDNAVVVTEAVFKHRQTAPAEPVAATLRGVREVGVATLAGTATSVVVFLPIVFGEANEATIFLVHVAVPIVVALIASLLVAQTLIPMVTSRLAPPPVTAQPWLDRLQLAYAGALAWLLRRRRRAATLLAGLLITTALMIGLSVKFPDRLLRIDMFPQDGGRQLVLDYRIEGTHPIERVAAAVATVERYLERNRERLDIESVYSRFDASSANSVLILREGTDELPAAQVMEIVGREIPEILIGRPAFSLDSDRATTSGGLDLHVSGESTDRLFELALELEGVLQGIEGIASLRATGRDGEREVRVLVDRARTAALGLDPQRVALAIAAGLRGDRLPELRLDDGEIAMRLVFRASDRQDLEDLRALPLQLEAGVRVTLGSVARLEIAQGPRAIERVDRRTSIALQAVLEAGATLPAVRARIEERLAGYRLPPGYEWRFGRAAQSQDEAAATMQVNLLLAVAMIFLVMAALFESTLLPLSVLASIVPAMIGALWTLLVTGTPLTFMALIGMQILIGVVVNIGIVLVAQIKTLRDAGLPREAAILQAARERLRPIVMTTMTTVLGLLPLAVGDSQLAIGIGGPSYAPMAVAIMGGLAFGALTSMLFVPVFYGWLEDASAAMRRWLRGEPRRPSAVSAAAP